MGFINHGKEIEVIENEVSTTFPVGNFIEEYGLRMYQVIESKKQGSLVENDLIMENLIIELNENQDENDRLIKTCKEMIDMYKFKIEEYETSKECKKTFVLSQIKSLLKGVDMKETKTQHSYKLPSATIIRKKAEKTIKLSEVIKEDEIPERFIKVKKLVNWVDFKKVLTIKDDLVVNTQTGEIIESCIIEEKLEEIRIKI